LRIAKAILSGEFRYGVITDFTYKEIHGISRGGGLLSEKTFLSSIDNIEKNAECRLYCVKVQPSSFKFII